MKKSETMTQCKLELNGVTDVAWIPTKFAKKGEYLEIQGTNGWKVLEVWDTDDAEEVIERERDFKKTRIASDISHGTLSDTVQKALENDKNNNR